MSDLTIIYGKRGCGKSHWAKERADLTGLPQVWITESTIDEILERNELPSTSCVVIDEWDGRLWPLLRKWVTLISHRKQELIIVSQQLRCIPVPIREMANILNPLNDGAQQQYLHQRARQFLTEWEQQTKR